MDFVDLLRLYYVAMLCLCDVSVFCVLERLLVEYVSTFREKYDAPKCEFVCWVGMDGE